MSTRIELMDSVELQKDIVGRSPFQPKQAVRLRKGDVGIVIALNSLAGIYRVEFHDAWDHLKAHAVVRSGEIALYEPDTCSCPPVKETRLFVD